MPDEPRGLNRCFTDAQLREDLENDLRPREIAEKYGVSRQAVYKRIGQLADCDTAAAVAPAESRRYVSAQINAMEELQRCLHRVNLLSDACDRYLQEVDEDGLPTGRYDVGPRAAEVQVTYWRIGERGEFIGKRPEKKDLQSLLDIALDPDTTQLVGAETKYADPRQLLLSTSAECRGILSTCMALAEKLFSLQQMQRLKDLISAALHRADAPTAARIAEELQRGVVLSGAFRGPDALPFTGE